MLICYALTSDGRDEYALMTAASAALVRRIHPGARILALVDERTDEALKAECSVVSRFVDDVVRVETGLEHPRRPESYIQLSDMYLDERRRLGLEHVVLSGMTRLQRPSLELFESLFHGPAVGRSVLGGLKARAFAAGLVSCKSGEDLERLVKSSMRSSRTAEIVQQLDPLAIACVVAVDAIRRRKFKIAERITATILDIQPAYIYAVYLRADILTRTRRHEEALRTLRKLGDLRDEVERNRFVEMLAINYLGLGDLERAEGLAAEVLRRSESGERYWRVGLGELGSAMMRSLAGRRRVRDAWSWWRVYLKNTNDINEQILVLLRSMVALVIGR